MLERRGEGVGVRLGGHFDVYSVQSSFVDAVSSVKQGVTRRQAVKSSAHSIESFPALRKNTKAMRSCR